MRRAWDTVAAYVMANAHNPRKGYRLRDLSDAEQLEWAAKEMAELVENPGDIEELADLLGCLFHYAMRKGWTMEALERTIIAKLELRFPETAAQFQPEPRCPGNVYSAAGGHRWVKMKGFSNPVCEVCDFCGKSRPVSGSSKAEGGKGSREAAVNYVKNQKPCDRPPAGWYCTRGKGHDGPCAAYLQSHSERVPERVVQDGHGFGHDAPYQEDIGGS